MDKEELKLFKELEDLKHKHKLIEIEEEKKAKIELANLEHDNRIGLERYKSDAIMSAHRLKRADFQRAREEKRRYEKDKDFMQNYANGESQEEYKT